MNTIKTSLIKDIANDLQYNSFPLNICDVVNERNSPDIYCKEKDYKDCCEGCIHNPIKP